MIWASLRSQIIAVEWATGGYICADTVDAYKLARIDPDVDTDGLNGNLNALKNAGGVNSEAIDSVLRRLALVEGKESIIGDRR